MGLRIFKARRVWTWDYPPPLCEGVILVQKNKQPDLLLHKFRLL